MRSFLKYALAGATVAAGILGPVQAVNAASYSIQITGYVPVICKVNGNTQQTLSGSDVNLGSITEFCNNPNGYQVWVDYTPGVTGNTLYVDGRAVPLSETGSTMIDSSSQASIVNRNLVLSGAAMPSSLSMRIVPL